MDHLKNIPTIRLILDRIKELEAERDRVIKLREEYSKGRDYLTSRKYNDFAKRLANLEDAILHNKKILYSIR